MTTAPRHQIAAIDLLRFACAALVMAFHYCTVLPLSDLSPVQAFDADAVLPAGGAGWTWFGWVGVELFFVISGYVIALSATGAARGDFLWRRVLRLAPAAWICASLTALTLIAGSAAMSAEVAPRWVASVLFLPTTDQIDAPYWTLRVEMVFYLIVALSLRGGGRSAPVERIGAALTAWSALYWAGALALGRATQDAIDTPLLYQLLLPHGAFFGLGIAISGVVREGWKRSRAGIAIVALATALVEIAVHAGTMRDAPGIQARPWVPIAIFLGGLALILGAARLQPWLGTRASAMLGRMTYPLYLLNLTLGAGLIIGFTQLGLSAPRAMVASAAVVLLTSHLIADHAEPAIRRLLRSGRALAQDTLRSAFPRAG